MSTKIVVEFRNIKQQPDEGFGKAPRAVLLRKIFAQQFMSITWMTLITCNTLIKPLQ